MTESGQIIRVTLWGMVVNLFLVGLKMAVGLVVNSAALIADAIHSVSDLSTDLAVILGIRLSSRPADEGHAYGHGKFETFTTSFIGIVLVAAGFYLAGKAGLSLYRQEESFPGYAVIVVAVVSIVLKEAIYKVTQRVAHRVKSSSLHANAWHHRSDALSSVAVLIGGIAGLSGWGYGDSLAAVVVGVMVAIVGFNALWKMFLELCEGSVSTKERELIISAIKNVPGVESWHRLRTRLVGRQAFMDVHVQVDAKLSVAEGHRICGKVECAIADSMDRPINIVVHCEPDADPDRESK